MNRKLTFRRNKRHHNNIMVAFGNVNLGELTRDVDGCFYWWPEETTGAWPAWTLRAIADKLDELNKDTL